MNLRDVVAGKTKIRPEIYKDKAKTVKNIVGFDAVNMQVLFKKYN